MNSVENTNMEKLMVNILDELKERNLVKQVVFEDDLREMLSSESVSFYVGFDPTADSLHVGHFATLLLASRLQKAGQKSFPGLFF